MLPEVHTMLPLATLVGKDSLKHASAKGKINMKKISKYGHCKDISFILF
jgi:hypothetical protein